MPIFDGDFIDSSTIHTHPHGSIILGTRRAGTAHGLKLFPDKAPSNELLYLSLNVYGIFGIHSIGLLVGENGPWD